MVTPSRPATSPGKLVTMATSLGVKNLSDHALFSVNIPIGDRSQHRIYGVMVRQCRGAAGGLQRAHAGGMLALMSDVTQILSAIENGDPRAAEQLLPLVYDELRKLAVQRLAQEKPGQTLQATALVHEAYLRLANPGRQDGGGDQHWNSRGHFFAAAAEAMRRILVESARRKNRLKHGREGNRVDLESGCLVSEAPSLDLLALDDALTKLAQIEPAKAELVKLRYFAGLTMPECAAALQISLATAERNWTFAKSWLFAELADDE
jgi:RNA polymerase sigma factor (TIGR02999 family)